MMNPVHVEHRSPGMKIPGRLLAAAGFSFAAALMPQAAGGESPERSGKEVVDAVCSACHRTGARGAPKIGDQQAWARLASRGLTSLTDSALKGIRNMPSHGGNPGLSDGEIERAITYMVNQSGGHWAEPVADVTSAAERRGKQIVEAQCSKCHATGVNGAPKIGDRNAWVARLKRGLDFIVRSAVHGHGPMPPRGGLADLTDSEIRAAVIYMFNPAAASTKEAPAAPAAAPDPNHRVVGNTEIFLGVLPAEAIRERYPRGGRESRMHGGIPTGTGYYHVNITLLDTKTKDEIKDAQVEVRVAEPVMGGETKTLERVAFNQVMSYGNYFRIQGANPYTITVRVQRPGTSRVIEAKFDFKR